MKHLLLAIASLLAFQTNAQTTPEFCGTKDKLSNSLVEWRANRDGIISNRSNDTLYLNLKVHIVGNSQGEGYYPEEDLIFALCKLNSDFAEIEVQFELDEEINYIDNSLYYEHNGFQGRQMMNQHNVPNMINSYIVNDPSGACGYYSFNGDAVALKKSCLPAGNSTWTHELGHFFSLPHTFAGWEGTIYEFGDIAPERVGGNNRLVEKVDGSNCRFAGDGFCDTDADYLSFRWSCQNSQSPGLLYDPDSVSFFANGKNFMSYSNDGCAREFSPDQTSAIRFNITSDRQSHYADLPMKPKIDFQASDLVVHQGSEGEAIQYDEAELSWAPVSGATGYLLELRKDLPFSTPDIVSTIVRDTTFQIDQELDIDTKYEWRVRPFNERDFCAERSEFNSFTATIINSTASVEDQDSEITLFPNPIQAGHSLQIQMNAAQFSPIEINLFDMAGNRILSQRNITNAGDILKLKTGELRSGIYLLEVMSEDSTYRKKVVVQ